MADTEKAVTFDVTVTMRGENGRVSPVSLTETFQVSASGFGDLLDVLEQFHTLAEKIRDRQAGLTRSGSERG